MKKLYIYIFAILGLLAACDDKDSETIVEQEELVPVKAQFEARSFDGEAKEVFGIGERITFLNTSEGKPDLIEWTLNNAVQNESEGKTVSAYYNKVGKYPVKLNVSRSVDGDTDELEVVDYITVEHAEVEAKIRASIPETNGIIDVVVGSIVTFEDISIGLPDDANREWEFEAGTVIEDKGRTQTVQYLTGGTFNVRLSVGRDSDPNSDPSFDEINKEDYVNIVAPDPYLVVGQAEMTAYNELLIPMDRDGLPLEGDVQDAFTISVVNGSFTQDIAVTSVEQIEATTEGGEAYLKLNLTEGLYNSDMITLAYDKSVASLYAHDGGQYGGDLESFTSHEVVPLIDDNLCEFLNNTPNFATFDNGGGNADVSGYWQAGGSGLWKRYTSNVYAGTGAMRYQGPTDSRVLWDFSLTNNGDIATGKYLMALRVFIPEGNQMKALFCFADNQPYGGVKSIQHIWNFENIVRGKWQTVYTHVDVQRAMVKDPNCRWQYRVRASDNPGITGEIEFLIDELRLIPLQTR